MLPVVLAVVALSDVSASVRSVALVERLGHRDFRVREQAGRELLEIGYPAHRAVAAGRDHEDGEVRERSRKLYPEIWRHNLDDRVRRFLGDPRSVSLAELPAAARWIAIAGDSTVSRRRYAEVVAEHAEVLVEVHLHPERLPALYRDFAQSLYQRTVRRPTTGVVERVPPTDADVLTLLFLGAAGGTKPTTNPGLPTAAFSTPLASSLLAEQLAPDTGNPAVRRLFASWLEKERSSITVRRGLDLAVTHQVRECVETARRIANDPATLPSLRAMALIGFARLGTADDIALLTPFLEDNRQISTVVVNGQRGTVQIRDVAMAAAVTLANQPLADFGFTRTLPIKGPAVTSYSYFAFGNDDDRDAAHAKWKAWATANLKK